MILSLRVSYCTGSYLAISCIRMTEPRESSHGRYPISNSNGSRSQSYGTVCIVQALVLSVLSKRSAGGLGLCVCKTLLAKRSDFCTILGNQRKPLFVSLRESLVTGRLDATQSLDRVCDLPYTGRVLQEGTRVRYVHISSEPQKATKLFETTVGRGKTDADSGHRCL